MASSMSPVIFVDGATYHREASTIALGILTADGTQTIGTIFGGTLIVPVRDRIGALRDCAVQMNLLADEAEARLDLQERVRHELDEDARLEARIDVREGLDRVASA